MDISGIGIRFITLCHMKPRFIVAHRDDAVLSNTPCSICVPSDTHPRPAPSLKV